VGVGVLVLDRENMCDRGCGVVGGNGVGSDVDGSEVS